ncbi:hypothetical protein TL16_g07197 [Triparma laevis f. inornata]|uniref:Uncharacterized protein n=1 Tax=Triparma laevis f. inornata TaxID=1714386 RepID=A0A9W7EFD6_9STRA|nr:hypothetical protein TL16_g07197 [Triparma laevis f. inornata]
MFASISFNEIGNIHPVDECFSVNTRLYLVWTPSPSEGGVSALSEHIAKANAECWSHVSLSEVEIADLSSKISIPRISFAGASDINIKDPVCICVYDRNGGFLMWNESYTMSFK